MMIIKSFSHALKMGRRSEHNKDMEELVGVAPDVESSRRCSLRPTNLKRSSDSLLSFDSMFVECFF